MKYVPLDDLKVSPKVSGFKSGLHEKIIGQDDAIREIVQVYQMHLAGMGPRQQPVGSFLFLGPTGTGKTRTVEATAEVIYGNPKAIIKIDCAEFQHSHEIAKLLGSPPGYTGHRETHPLLTQEGLNQWYTEKIQLSFVLFDEIEKANNALWNLLLGILDKATLTLGDNNRVDFTRTMVFMTGNLGAREIDDILNPRFGFLSGSQQSAVSVKGLGNQISKAGTTAARKKFTPEFLNRIDKIVVFEPLGEEQLRKILGLELIVVKHRIAQSTAINGFFDFELSLEAENFLLEKGTDIKSGARPLKRAIQKFLVGPLAAFMTTGQVERGDNLIIDVDLKRKKLYFMKEEREEEKRPIETRRQPKTVSFSTVEPEKAAEAAVGRAHD